ncbi:hypothetical protein DRH13_02530 [Candidatus Woesebacteria bacterium]|nr:MAG: hypothetical protein DRH13_02530 [Candidatus Woesebacteria bacterium]
MDKLLKMVRQLSKKHKDSWILHEKYVDVKLTRRKRHQRVYLRLIGQYYFFVSVVMGSIAVTKNNRKRSDLARMAWRRNADHEIVNFAFDKKNRLVGVIRHPAKYLDPEELELYITTLTYECDRFEFMISGRDTF